MSIEQNKLSNVSNFNINRIIFSKVQKKTASNITYNTISIKVKNTKSQSSSELDGTFGDLVFSTSEIWSPGVQENKFAPGTWNMPLFLYGINGASDEEKQFVQTFTDIVEHAKRHIVSVKSEIGKPRLSVDSDSFEKFNPLWFKRNKDTGDVDTESSPVFYVKLLQNKKDGGDSFENVLSRFLNSATKKIIPFKDMINKKCNIKAVIKFESIFINAKTISLQIKLVDACVRTKSSVQYYLTENVDEQDDEEEVKDEFDTKLNLSPDVTQENPLLESYSDDDEMGSVKASDDETESVPEPPAPVVETKTTRKSKKKI